MGPRLVSHSSSFMRWFPKVEMLTTQAMMRKMMMIMTMTMMLLMLVTIMLPTFPRWRIEEIIIRNVSQWYGSKKIDPEGSLRYAACCAASEHKNNIVATQVEFITFITIMHEFITLLPRHRKVVQNYWNAFLAKMWNSSPLQESVQRDIPGEAVRYVSGNFQCQWRLYWVVHWLMRQIL